MTVHVQPAEDAFDSLGRQLGDLVDEMSQRRYYRFSRSVGWQPAVNLYEDEHRFYLCVDLAGLARERIDVGVIGRKLLIRGERPAPAPPRADEPCCILRMEIDSGPFERTIELPDQADVNAVEAKLDQGFLWITIGKRTC